MTMQPHSLGTLSLENQITPAQRKVAAGWMGRHDPALIAKGLPLPETQVPACPKVKVADLPEGHLKQKWIDHLEQNQLIKSCCRHPENHFVEARKSHPEELAPDIYIFTCDKCGKAHRFFCVGATDDNRPVWDAS
jgi:hypothetical protein